MKVTNSKIHYLLKLLAPAIVSQTAWETCPDNILSQEFYCDQTSFHAGTIYLFPTPCTVRLMEQKIIFPGAIMLFFDDPEADLILKKEHRNYIGLSLKEDFIHVYNRINQMLCQYQTWRNTLFNVHLERFSLEYLLDYVKKELGRELYYLNREYQILYPSHLPEDSFHLPKKEPDETLFALSKEETIDACQIYRENGHIYCISQVCLGSACVGYVIALGNETEKEDLPTLTLLLACAIRNRLNESAVLPSDQQEAFTNLLQNVLNGDVREEKDLIRLFQALPCPVRKYIRCIIIGFDSGSPSENLILQFQLALQKAFPNTNQALWQNEIVLLLTYDEQPAPFLEEESRQILEDILPRFHACAGIGEPFRRYGHFWTQYKLVRRLLKISYSVRFRREERLFTLGDNIHYLIIDLALKSFIQEYGHYNFAYLIHPAVIRLARYDASHGTDLLNLLHIWLQNNQSAAKTAELVYMHRNTVLNKIKKISALTGCDLNDPAVQSQFLIACCLLRYSEKYLHRNLLESDFVFHGKGEDTSSHQP